MVKYNEQQLIDQYHAGLSLRGQICDFVRHVWESGIKNVCFLGIGGTWASSLQAVVHMKEKSALEVFALNAAEYLATGERRIGKGTFVIFSSVTGTTSEMVSAVGKAREAGAAVLGFVDTPGTELASLSAECISSPRNEQLKFFMTADALMRLEGSFPAAEYDEFYAQLDAHLACGLAAVEREADGFAQDFVNRNKDNELTYFVGAGALYGATYSYAMCYWEEMHWMRTKSIHAAEFFHGMLEIIGEDTPVVVLQGEDSQRPLTERVIRFLEKVNRNYYVIDSKNWQMPGIDEKYRGYISHMIVHAVTNRIDANLEAVSGHDMELRRYYRKMEY